MKQVVYLNLTNGLEKTREYPGAHFVRIQSSHCESHDFDAILAQLDSDLLFNLAIGRKIIVVDGSSSGRLPKALRVGVPVIEYVLNRIWFGRKVKRHPLTPDYLDKIYRSISDKTKTKLKYYRKFLGIKSADISVAGFKTAHDGDYEFYAEIARKINDGERASCNSKPL